MPDVRVMLLLGMMMDTFRVKGLNPIVSIKVSIIRVSAAKKRVRTAWDAE